MTTETIPTTCPRCDGPSCPSDEMGWCHKCQLAAAWREGTAEGMGVCDDPSCPSDDPMDDPVRAEYKMLG